MGNTTIANVANTIIGAPTAGLALWGMDGSLLANGKLNFMAIDGMIQPKLKDLDEMQILVQIKCQFYGLLSNAAKVAKYLIIID